MNDSNLFRILSNRSISAMRMIRLDHNGGPCNLLPLQHLPSISECFSQIFVSRFCFIKSPSSLTALTYIWYCSWRFAYSASQISLISEAWYFLGKTGTHSLIFPIFERTGTRLKMRSQSKNSNIFSLSKPLSVLRMRWSSTCSRHCHGRGQGPVTWHFR